MREDWLELFDAYCAGSLPSGKVDDFETRLMKDTAFKEAFDDFNISLHAADFAAYKLLKEELIQAKAKHSSTKTQFGMIRWVAAAAVILLILTSVSWYFSSQQIIERNRLKPQMAMNRSVISDEDATLRDHLILGDLAAAYAQLKNRNMSSGLPNSNIYLLGNLAIAMDEPQVAINAFAKLLNAEDERFLESAQHQIAVAYLQDGRKEDALKALDTIMANAQHSKLEEAVTMKNQLNGFFHKYSFFP